MKKTKTLLIKLSEEDLKQIKLNAIQYSNGNVSAWIRKSAGKKKESNDPQNTVQ